MKQKKHLFLLLLALVISTTESIAQTFQGVTEGDKAVTYRYRQGYACIESIDAAQVADGVVEFPAKVNYNGTDYSIYFMQFSPAAEAVKKLIIHGNPYSFQISHLNVSFPNLEEIVTDQEEGQLYYSKDGVVYKAYNANHYETLLWCPVKWNPAGKSLFQAHTTRIDQYACRKVEQLAEGNELVIPNSITSIGQGAFCETNLQSVVLPTNDTYTRLYSHVFWKCPNLSQVFIPDNVKELSYGALAQCKSLTSIDLNKVTTLGSYVFYQSNISTITGTNHLSSLSDFSFSGCDKLSSIDFSQSAITEFPLGTFSACKSLSSIGWPHSLLKIGNLAFSGIESIREITIPEGVTTIGMYVFGAKGFETIHLPSTISSMSGYAFAEAEDLRTITIAEDNSNFVMEDGILFNKAKTRLVFYPWWSNRKSYLVPANVTEIGDAAFFIGGKCTLEHVTVPSACTRIGYDAFNIMYSYTSSYTPSVTVPTSVRILGGITPNEFKYAYFKEPLITTTMMRSISSEVFYGWDVYLMGTHPEDITAQPYFFRGSFYKNRTMYLTKSGLANLKASPVYNATSWKSAQSFLADEVPVTLSSTGLSTMCRDFDADLGESDGLEVYVASSFQKTGDDEADLMNMSKVSTGTYVPSRFGVDNYEFCGVVLKGEPGTSYTYRIGENDYQSGSQTLLSDEQTNGNMLVGAPVHTTIGMTDGDKTNFVLKGGKFRYVTQEGELGWNKAYLQIPTASYEAAGAKGFRLVFDEDSEITRINSAVQSIDKADTPYYNLNGQRVEYPQHGVYIHNGKKIVIK